MIEKSKNRIAKADKNSAKKAEKTVKQLHLTVAAPNDWWWKVEFGKLSGKK